MRPITRAIIGGFVLLIVSLWVTSRVPAQTSEDSGQNLQPPDSTSTAEAEALPSDELIFNEIELSSEGVVAFDSLGRRWFYDFDRDEFVSDRSYSATDQRTEGRRTLPETIEPVEERCTERLEVPSPALRPVFVGYTKYVDEDIIAYGKVTIRGWVRGNVQSINKRVEVTPSGRVDGHIKAPVIVVKPGAVVIGRTITTDPLSISVDAFKKSFSTVGIWIVIGFTVALLLIAFLLVSLAPRQLENISECIEGNRLKTFFLGLLVIFLLPLIITLLAITVVGILIIPLLPVALLVVLVIGMTTFGRFVWKVLLRKRSRAAEKPMIEAVAGVLFFMLLWFGVAVLMGTTGSVAEGFGVFLLVVAILLTVWPFLGGTGAAVLTRFGYKKYISFRRRQPQSDGPAPAPAPPPIPEVPPVVPLTPRAPMSHRPAVPPPPSPPGGARTSGNSNNRSQSPQDNNPN